MRIRKRLQGVFCKMCRTILEMDYIEAKKLVLRRDESSRINRNHMARSLGVSHTAVQFWLSGTEPKDPMVWVRMADILGLTAESPVSADDCRELALLVLERSEDVEQKAKAASILRQFFEKKS